MASYNFVRPPADLAFQFDKIPYSEPVPVLRKFFYYRAWNTVQSLWETWVSIDAPDPYPPSGDAFTGLTRALFWKKVV